MMMMRPTLVAVACALALAAPSGVTGALAGESAFQECQARNPDVLQVRFEAVNVCVDEACTNAASLMGAGGTVDAGIVATNPGDLLANFPGGGDVATQTYLFLQIIMANSVSFTDDAGALGPGEDSCRTPGGTASDGVITSEFNFPGTAQSTVFMFPVGTAGPFASANGGTITSTTSTTTVLIPLIAPLELAAGATAPVPQILVNNDEWLFLSVDSDRSDEECGWGLINVSLDVSFDGFDYIFNPSGSGDCTSIEDVYNPGAE